MSSKKSDYSTGLSLMVSGASLFIGLLQFFGLKIETEIPTQQLSTAGELTIGSITLNISWILILVGLVALILTLYYKNKKKR